MTKKRLLTGDRPTGKLHLGHYIGSLRNRVGFQDKFQCFFIIADLHTLTTRPHKEQIGELGNYIHDIVLDYLSVGIDPQKSSIFVQSSIPEISELNTLLGMLVNVPRLERIPSLKEMAEAANLSTMPFGLLGYPVLMSADILLPRAHMVPVGTDNQAHVELARELARRFNRMYQETFPIPEFQLEDTLIGIDGQSKMSKSLNNAIYLTDTTLEVENKVMSMYTDPNRLTIDTPGRVKSNPVFIYHDLFNRDSEEIAHLKERYRQGKVGDVEVKVKLARAINEYLDPIRERRRSYEKQPDIVEDILSTGSRQMQVEAQETISMVRDAMGITLNRYVQSKSIQSLKRPSQTPIQGLAFI